MDSPEFVWTDGMNDDFQRFYKITENYYNKVVGDKKLRKGFIPHNNSALITEALVVYVSERPVACAGLKKYSDRAVEAKRIWVEPQYRKNGIGSQIFEELEKKAKDLGYKKLILQTRAEMTDALKLYDEIGFERIVNYPPYDHLEGAMCFAKAIN